MLLVVPENQDLGHFKQRCQNVLIENAKFYLHEKRVPIVYHLIIT